MVTKLIEVKLGENGCSVRVIEGGSDLCMTKGQIDRAKREMREEGIPLYLYQEYGDGTDAWVAFLQLLNNEFGPAPEKVIIEESRVRLKQVAFPVRPEMSCVAPS